MPLSLAVFLYIGPNKQIWAINPKAKRHSGENFCEDNLLAFDQSIPFSQQVNPR